MSLRPQPATWFHLVIAREDLLAGLRTLATTAAVELQGVQQGDEAELARALKAEVAHFHAFLDAYAGELPQPVARIAQPANLLAETRQAMDRLAQWQQQAGPVLSHRQALTDRIDRLAMQARLARRAAPSVELAKLAQAGPVLASAFVQFRETAATVPCPEASLFLPLPGENASPAGIILLPRQYLPALAQSLAARKAILFTVPADWQGNNDTVLARLDAALSSTRLALEQAEQELEQINVQYGAAQHLGWMVEMAWLVEQLPGVRLEAVTAYTQGWCALPAVGELNRLLEQAQVRGLVQCGRPPAGQAAPMVLRNPRWATPFEVFIRALGMPGTGEADPSVLLAVIVPLIFGYMFGDAGQGTVLVLLGLYLRRRFPLARLLVPGGCMAIVFGLLFGTVFSLHGVLPPLWLEPLSAPLTILEVPLLGGFVLLSLGLCLNALEAWWQKQAGRWLRTQAGILLAYWGGGLAVAHPGGLYLLIFGLIWHFAGYWQTRPGPRALLDAVAALLESGMQLAVNTLSFVRIGAFALAHAGLSMAIVSLAPAGSGRLATVLVLVLGNAAMILLESMVVSIQTTRLILLEFFLRFAAVHGRILKPLALPDVHLPGMGAHEKS